MKTEFKKTVAIPTLRNSSEAWALIKIGGNSQKYEK
jgi:hypothetical protein